MARDDDALFARLRAAYEQRDPMPEGLVERMVAAVAVADISREYALLTLVEGEYAEVRGEGDTSTLQFSDGRTSVLLHVTVTEGDGRRVDGWVDATALTVRLVQGENELTADVDEQGRFAFPDARPGIARVRLTVRAADGSTREFQTPQFEV
ncbi:hypothetical protein [Microbacterium luticocti]|uniref:hypothetical protein n=1 Tax=Microbacterium luticocti TaxID=451764 RepID=UPI0003F7F294|nr:hypothetical protein [Microbacterium luticocti]